MIHRLWADIRRDWAAQPLAIISQWSGLLLALLLYFLGKTSFQHSTPLGLVFSGSIIGLSVAISLAVFFGTISRYVIKRSVISGFMVSLITACVCVYLAMSLQIDLLIKTTKFKDDVFVGPIVNLTYWTIFGVYVAIRSSSSISRLGATWGQLTTETANGSLSKLGVAPFEILIFAAVWGRCLSYAQQQILMVLVSSPLAQ